MPAGPSRTLLCRHRHQRGAAQPVGLDQIVASANAAGMAPGFEVSLPSGKEGVYTAAVFPDDIAKQRTIHFDQYTGKPLVDIKFADYGTGAKAIEFGIGVHQGEYLGLANQIVMLDDLPRHHFDVGFGGCDVVEAAAVGPTRRSANAIAKERICHPDAGHSRLRRPLSAYRVRNSHDAGPRPVDPAHPLAFATCILLNNLNWRYPMRSLPELPRSRCWPPQFHLLTAQSHDHSAMGKGDAAAMSDE